MHYTKFGNPTTTGSSSGAGGSSSRVGHGNQVTLLLRDILSVQATSVASESAFLTSERVLSIRRTRLTPASLKICMCLKDHLNAQERKQDRSTLETPVDFEEEILDAEMQANEAIPLSDEEIVLDATSSEGSMSGPGSRGEEAEANYDYNVYHDDY
nr:zinc finger BED domain-containing protein RICESLEEPER 2 [Tanacetum cinerariifolium]